MGKKSRDNFRNFKFEFQLFVIPASRLWTNFIFSVYTDYKIYSNLKVKYRF